MITSAVAVLLGLSAVSAADDAAVVAQLKTSALPLTSVEAGKGLSDLMPLKSALADVRIVGMGEATHGTREIFQMKHRMFEFLVKEMGYTVFAIEASMPDCVAMDRYVLTGEGGVDAAVKAQGFWTWSTHEVADLIKWMRAYNADATNTKKLRVVGFDMQNRYGAANFLKDELAKVGVTDAEMFDKAMNYPYMLVEPLELVQTVKKALPDIEEKSGAEHARLVEQISVVYKQAHDNDRGQYTLLLAQKVGPHFRETIQNAEKLLEKHPDLEGDALAGLQVLVKGSKQVYEPTKEEQAKLRDYYKALWNYGDTASSDREELMKAADILEYFASTYENIDVRGVNYRDKCMAENMSWIVNEYLPGSKAMAWGHNMHVARWEPQASSRWMGAYLNDVWKDKYYPVGFSFYKGSFQAREPQGGALKSFAVGGAKEGSLDAVLNQVGQKQFFLDLRGLQGEARDWFDVPRTTRSIGAIFQPSAEQNYMLSIRPLQVFDGLIFIADTTRARPL